MKQSITDWTDITFNSLHTFWTQIASVLPKLIGAAIILLIGWILARVISFGLKKILTKLKVTKVGDSFLESSLFRNMNVNMSISNVIGNFAYWFILLMFFVIAANAMGWEQVSAEIGNLFRYLPRLFIAALIFFIGTYIAKVVSQLILATFDAVDFAGSKLISRVAYYIILIIITITALNQAGVDTTVISANISIILAAILLAFALGFGLASKSILNKVLLGFYSQQHFEEGQVVQVGDIKGEIVSITNVSVCIKTEDGKEVIPTDIFMNQNVKVYD
jgi:small-conductance mechanosensitive channel